ncbi:PD-(D/E)XK nuclease family protein [Salinibaculum rarum]|uniref:PD-(D/E)XK nuclease family protein n=1 Tax=Salinibaculum rarum TaxID=3058903 RepID=UPI00265EC620|nr:PD-(D/E)XK nuclease family protein [Salinibaculum sp. KK48]
MSDSHLEDQLLEIEQQLDSVEEVPATTLSIIGQPRKEKYWEDLLVYFLDHTNPHGFGTDVLDAFVRSIAAHSATKLPRPSTDLTAVQVQSQVPTASGPFDILLWLENEWFVCLELKSKSPESNAQTVRYAEAPQLGDLDVETHEGVAEYVYLAPATAAPSQSERFVDITWEHVIEYFEQLMTESRGQYPAKSEAQLADYIDTIKHELNMGDITDISTETELYIKYADTIETLTENFERDKKKIFNSLTEAFFATGECQKSGWTVNRTQNYVNFYKPSWRDVGPGVNIEYEPHIELQRAQPVIRLRLDIEHGDKEAVREQVTAKLTPGDREALEAADWEFTDGSWSYLAKPVHFDVTDPEASIRTAAHELHNLRDIIEPHIDSTVETYSNS